MRFYSREEVKDALAYLSLLVNRTMRSHSAGSATSPAGGSGQASVEKIVREWRAGGGDLTEACRRQASRLPARARAGLLDLLAIISELGPPWETRPSPSWPVLLSRTGLYEMYRSGTARTAPRRRPTSRRW